MAGVLDAAESAPALPEPRRYASTRVWRRLVRQPVTLAAGFILTAIFVAGALVPQYTPPVAHIHLSQRWLNHPPMLSGWHLLGTARMGTDPETSVVDGFCRSHDVPNLFVIDGSVFVTSTGVNPTATIMAVALRAMRHLADHHADQVVPS